MIVQTGPAGEANLIIYQVDHARLSGQFARVFGNENFAPLTPKEPVEFIATHHDEGWVPVDSLVIQDERTGLPYNLISTPLSYLLKTSAGSPAFNEQHDPYSGVLSSMHSYGLFNGRYGLSDKIFVDSIPKEEKPAVDIMLRAELDRQERLIEILNGKENSAPWISEATLFHNYKLLQFFDTLALYFNMVHENARVESQFPNVPQQIGQDVTIHIRPVDSGTYALAPYPFRKNGINFSYRGRYMRPQPLGADLKAIWESTEPVEETIKLIAG